MDKLRLTIALLVALAASTTCLAETLEDAWVIALANDQSLQAIRSQTAAAAAELAATKSSRMPVFNIDSAITQLDNTPAVDIGQLGLPVSIAIPNAFSNDNFVTASARLSMPLYTSGLISSGIDAAGAALNANQKREDAFQLDVKLAVAESFVAVLRAQRAVAVADTNVTSLEAHVGDVESMYRKGLVPQNDLLAVQVSLANARQTALQASNALDIASAAYNRRLGRDLNSPVSLDEVMPTVDQAAMSEDIEALTASALSARTELQALRDQSAALRYQAKAERARTKPQFAASAGYTFLENEILRDETFSYASIGFTWSPFDGGRSRYRASKFSRQAQSVTDQHNDVISLIRLQVRSTWLEIKEVRQRLAVTEKATRQAEENLRVAKSRYQNGIGTNTEVLDAETLRSITQSNHNNARYDAALARLRLARAIGVL